MEIDDDFIVKLRTANINSCDTYKEMTGIKPTNIEQSSLEIYASLLPFAIFISILTQVSAYFLSAHLPLCAM